MLNKLKRGVKYIIKKIKRGIEIMSRNINDAKCAAAETVETGIKVYGDIKKAKLDMIKSVGNAVCNGTKSVGNAVCNGTKSVGNAVCNGTKSVGNIFSNPGNRKIYGLFFVGVGVSLFASGYIDNKEV